MDTPDYTLSQVAAAAGVEAGTLRSWLQRKHWRLDMAIGDSPAEIAGRAHLVTLRRALQIGTAIELVRNGVEPARAFTAARAFSDIYDGLERLPRTPGGLFEDPAYTLLALYPDETEGVVIPVFTEGKHRTPLSAILFPEHHYGGDSIKGSGVFVWLNRIDQRIRTALASKA
jgi:hypothetical protein